MKKRNSGFIIMIASLLLASCANEDGVDNQMNAPPQKTVKSELTALKSGATVELKDGKYYWMGDVMLSDAQFKQLEETGDIFSKNQEIGKEDGVLLSSPITGYACAPQNLDSRSTAIYPTAYNLWAMVRFTYAKSGTRTTLSP